MQLKIDYCRYCKWLNEPVYALYIKKGWFWRKVKESKSIKVLMMEENEIIDCELGKITEV